MPKFQEFILKSRDRRHATVNGSAHRNIYYWKGRDITIM